MAGFGIILFFATTYCLAVAYFKYKSGFGSDVFFYHNLVSPFNQHAIQFSILLFIALVFLGESFRKKVYVMGKPFSFFLIIYLSFFLLLLSSKLVLSFYVVYLFYFFFDTINTGTFHRRLVFPTFFIFIVIIALTLFTSNPIGKRFHEINSGNISLIQEKHFNQGIYFNGLQFRILQWRFVYEILNESNSWILGLSSGDAQSYLDQKYISTNMYTGKEGTGDHGFLGYHTHNAFLQVLLQNGIVGLGIFLFICYSLIKMVSNRRNSVLTFSIFLILFYFYTDAVLETQYGLIIFTFFPVFIYLGTREQRHVYY